MRKIISVFIVLIYICSNLLSVALALNTDERSSPWTREKASHLAHITLFNADKNAIDALFAAGSASAALNILFPNTVGPDRTAFNTAITNYTSSGFNWGDANHTTRLYQMMYAGDPYEAKRKLFSLFEDIFPVNRDTDRDITYKDIYDLHSLLFNNMLGNYESLVKKVMNNNGAPGDYAEGRFLDLFDQKDPAKPNENFARELLQLFLMGEYEPYRSKDNGDIRNYEESDVIALAKILTGLKSDNMTHIISFDINNHYIIAPLKFLSGSISSPPPYYNVASGTIDPVAILNPVNGNNGFTDNVIEYIFTQKSDQIALFLADRIARFYMSDKPTRMELDQIAQIIKNNNFDMLLSIKTILALDMIYSNASMNTVRYKNPLELTIGSIRFLRNNSLSGIAIDPNVYNTNLLRRLGWTPYFPGSIFGRDGFDNSLKWSSTSTQSAWMSASNYFTYRTSGTGAIDFLSMLGSQKIEITTGNISIMTHTDNSYSGSLTVVSGTLNLGNPILGASIVNTSLSRMRLFSVGESVPEYVYPLDPIVSILGGENLDLFVNTSEDWISDDIFLPQKEIETLDTIETLTPEKTEITAPVLIATGMIDGNTGSIISDTGHLDGNTGFLIVDTGSVSTGVEDIKIDTQTITGETLIPDVSASIIKSEVFSDVSTGVINDNSGQDISSGATIISDLADSGTINSGTVSTGSTYTGTILPIVIIETGSTSTGSSGETNSIAIVPQQNNITTLTNTVMISTGSVTLPLFKVVTGLGTITIFSGTYSGDTRTLLIHSGAIVSAGSSTEVLEGSSIVFDTNSKLIADTVSADTILDTYETYIYGEKRLPTDVKVLLKDFLMKDSSGATIPVAPTNTNYFNKYIRGLLSILMSQPEYVLLSGYDLPPLTNTTDQHFLDNITGKLFFVELYGGNDYLTSIIPKDEYSTYLDYRTNQTGSIAITGTGLVDIGNFYMNSALAYSSGGGPGFKDLYDQGYLKIFNRVGGYKHSNDHDAAAKQITSYDNTTAMSAEGAFGHLVKQEFESSNTISLGSKLPNIYRAGHFVNFGGSVILTNPLDQSGKLRSHMDMMQNITLARTYPADTRNLFRDVGRISEIAKMSVAQGGPAGASGDMNSIFGFAKVLMDNNVGRSFYMGGYGGYDTHGDQFNGLNRNLNFVSTAVSKFFNEVKDTQDVTIVIFSEFGRTNKTNGDLGTDHGDGGGMYVITSNAALRSSLQAGTYGNMSIKNAKYNSLGIGVDYRSVYGSIFNSLYGLDPSTYFGTHISLADDISMIPNDISLLNYSYRASGQTPLLDIEMTVSGNNFSPGKAGYTRLLSGTGLINQKTTRLNENIVPEGYRYNFQINPNNQPYFSIESFSNQYATNGFSGTLTGATRPMILGNNIRTISQTGTSILPLFANTIAPSVLSGSGIILESTGSNSISIASNNQIRLLFASGVTNVLSLTYSSGSAIWKGGFALAEKIDKDLFIPTSAILLPDNTSIQILSITHLFKIGADLRGVGMNLNQAVGIEFSGLVASGSYRAISSQDGITWSDVESAGRLYTSSSTGSILVSTDHFSYFALLSMASIVISPPSCTITINPNSILNGSGATLSWTMANALTGTLNPGNILLGTSGSVAIIPPSNATTPYTLTVTNSAGTNSCVASVTAAPVIVPPIPIPSCTIAINPNSILNGSGATLSWTMANALTGTLNPGNILLGTSGSVAIIPPSNATTPYTLTVTNSAGTNSCVASVTAAPVIVPPIPIPSCTIAINPNSILNGSGATLSWTMANALTGTLNPGNILLGTSGSMMVIPPSNTTTSYILTVINSGGSNSCTTSVIASAIVVPPPGGGGGIVTGPGGGGGGTLSTITHPIDSCLGGDFSGNSFDGICHSIAHTMGRPISGNISTDIINTLHTSVTLNRLISDLEREDGDTLSNNQVQHTYAIALGIWREISTKKDTTTIQETINTLKNIRNTTKTIKTKIALDTIVRILEQFMKNGVNEFRLNPSMDITRNTNISESSDMDNSEYTTTTTFGTPKYVQAERSVTFRKTEYVGLYNILDYLSRNTEVTLISEGMNGWTRVLYNGLEGYIKSVYLRDGNDADILRSGRTVADYHPQGYINVAQSAYVRSLPEANARIISVVYRDDIVRILDSTPGWYEILSDNGVHGYIRKELVNTMDTTF